MRTKLAYMDKRLDVVERLIPALKLRGRILRAAITDAGVPMPRLPVVHWPEGK